MCAVPGHPNSCLTAIWRNAVVCRVLFAAVVILCPVTSARADDLDALSVMQRRLDALEQQNSHLMKMLQHRQLPTADERDVVSTSETAITAGLDSEVGSPGGNLDAQIWSEAQQQPNEHMVIAASRTESTEFDDAPDGQASDLMMHASWHHGLELETADKAFRVHVGGRVQFDGSWYEADRDLQFGPGGTGAFEDGVDFRRARFRIDGTKYGVIDWAAEFDFSNSVREDSSVFNVPAPTDLWITLTHLPYVGHLRVGNMKEPIGFEHLVSSRFLPFMERSFNQDAFYGPFNNGFTPGLMAFNTAFDEHMTWWIGLFKVTSNAFAFNSGGGEYAATARLTFLPWYEDEGRQLLHVGVSARNADLDEGHIRYRARGALRGGAPAQWPVLADTRFGGIDIAGDDNQMFNAEVAMVYGPWTLQSDYLANFVQDASQGAIPDVGTLFYHGGYVQVLYFLTGESDQYNKKNGAFDRVIPNENFFPGHSCDGCTHCGLGAWQVGLRYSHLDLNDKAIDGGILDDLTLGLNWFLNPNMKIQANYSVTHRDSASRQSDGTVQGAGVRFAHDF